VPGSVRGALRLLMQNPRLALLVSDPRQFRDLDDPDLPLLGQLLEYLQLNPDASLGALLGYWYGSPEGELLARLAAEEPVPGADAEAEFVDVIAHLDARSSALGTEARRRELEQTPFHEMSPAQKQEYLRLLSSRPK
jgi:DNA primase